MANHLSSCHLTQKTQKNMNAQGGISREISMKIRLEIYRNVHSGLKYGKKCNFGKPQLLPQGLNINVL